MRQVPPTLEKLYKWWGGDQPSEARLLQMTIWSYLGSLVTISKPADFLRNWTYSIIVGVHSFATICEEALSEVSRPLCLKACLHCRLKQQPKQAL